MPSKIRESPLPSPLSFLDKVANLEKEQGRMIIRFDLAEPQFSPPKAAIEGTIAALRDGRFRYSPSRGLPELIDAIRTYLRETRGLQYGEREVLVTTGGKFANYAFFSSLFRKGDGVVLLKPYWTSFAAVPEMLGLKKYEVWSDAPYHLNSDLLLEAMTKRPKAIVVNTPNNPTGGILNGDDIKLLCNLATDYDLWVLSDEIDWAYTFDGRKHISPASLAELRDRAIVTDGFSKVFSMTGWRVGFAAGPKGVIEKMHSIQEHSISSPTTFAQWGCVEAIKSSREYIADMLKKCSLKRLSVMKTLKTIATLDCPLPEGGFYVYPRVLDRGSKGSLTFCEELLRHGGVSVIPGSMFGDTRATFRLCYAVSDDLLDEGMKRLVKYFNSKTGAKKSKKEKMNEAM